MYQVAGLAAEAAALRAAVTDALPFRPLMVKIKLTRHCNLACPMCGFWREEGDDLLSAELVARTLQELAALGCRKVHFSGGEPTLRADLPELVAHARNLKLRVTVTTNGTLLTRSLCKHLVAAGLNSVNVSLDAPAARLHDRMRGVQGAFKRTIAGIQMLRQVAEERGAAMAIRINTVVSRENYEALAGMPALARQIGACSLLPIAVDDSSGALLLNKRRLLDYNRRIAPVLAEAALALGLIDDRRRAYPFGITRQELAASREGYYAHGQYLHQPCYAPWTHAQVQADGRVVPCCMSSEPLLGNLLSQSFTEVWRGEVFHCLRLAMAAGRPLPNCARCDMFREENRVLHGICRGEGAGGIEGSEGTEGTERIEKRRDCGR